MPVYFIRSGSDGPVKIGSTNNVRRRMQMLQTGSANQLVLLRAFVGGEAEEKAIHNRLSRFRVSGEWFEASDEVLTACRIGHLGADNAAAERAYAA
ncbi:GIY-YIG nuclease family protein [Komagataeibacter melaceti]|nr:GIY-YIG nuclease family protein [Komagataeibacter melaceti]